MKKLQAEVSKMNDRLAILDQKSAAQSLPTPVNSFNMFKRELKIAGTITDSANKDKLSFCGLIRQINSAIAKGYTETGSSNQSHKSRKFAQRILGIYAIIRY